MPPWLPGSEKLCCVSQHSGDENTSFHGRRTLSLFSTLSTQPTWAFHAISRLTGSREGGGRGVTLHIAYVSVGGVAYVKRAPLEHLPHKTQRCSPLNPGGDCSAYMAISASLKLRFQGTRAAGGGHAQKFAVLLHHLSPSSCRDFVVASETPTFFGAG